MLDIPAELLIMISIHLGHQDLRALTVASRSICRSLLLEYLRRRGLVLKDACARGLSVELNDLAGYASLGFWTAVHIFQPPEEMYCSIPCGTQEAQSAIRFLLRFLLEPSNTYKLRDFHFSLHGSDPLLLTSELIKVQQSFYTLPLTRLCFSGHISADYLPSSIALRSRRSCASHSLMSFTISSDLAFTPGLVQTTLSILRHSPLKSLAIYWVSLKPSQWSILLGELNMTSLEDIELEGDIPQPTLIRFLTKNKALRNIRIRCKALSDRTQPNRRSRCQAFLPNLLTLDAPLAVCCDIVGRIANSSSLYRLEVGISRLHPQQSSFHHLLETLRHFQKLDHLGLRIVQSSSLATSQASPNGHDWDRCPARELRQIRTLSFFQGRSRLSPGDVVRSLFLSSCLDLTRRTGDGMRLCTIISYGGGAASGGRGRRVRNATPRFSV